MKKIGLLFGSFNPLHNGHIALAKAAKTDAKLDEVWFVVQEQNNYKPNLGFISYPDRKKLIVKSGLKIYEPKSNNHGHLILDTLKEIKGYDITLILGEDLVVSFTEWTDYNEIKQHAKIYKSSRIDGISSGVVRDRLAAGQSIDHLVPPAVASYLAPHQS